MVGTNPERQLELVCPPMVPRDSSEMALFFAASIRTMGKGTSEALLHNSCSSFMCFGSMSVCQRPRARGQNGDTLPSGRELPHQGRKGIPCWDRCNRRWDRTHFWLRGGGFPNYCCKSRDLPSLHFLQLKYRHNARTCSKFLKVGPSESKLHWFGCVEFANQWRDLQVNLEKPGVLNNGIWVC